MMKSNTIQFLLIAFFGLILFSCSNFAEQSFYVATSISTKVPTSINSVTPEITANPTITPFPANSTKTSFTPSPNLERIVYSNIPTLSVDQAYAYFYSIYETIGKCEIPCWGEIIPGITTMEEAHNILGPISQPEHSDTTQLNDQGSSYLRSEVNWRRDLGDIYIDWIIYGENRIVTDIQFYIMGDDTTLSHMLATYGKPDEVWVTYLDPLYSEANIFIGFYFESANTFVKYYLAGEEKRGFLEGCGINYQYMYTWAENVNHQVIEYLYGKFYPGEKEGFRDLYNLETTTTWDIDTFIEDNKYMNDKEVCITVKLDSGE